MNAVPRIFLAVLCLLAGFFAPTSRDLSADARPNGGSRPGPILKIGESWQYDRELKVTFLEVMADTRRFPESRPAGSERDRIRGNAGVVLRLEAGNQEAKTVRLNTVANPDHIVVAANEFPEGVVGIPKSYVIAIQKLLPDASKRGTLRAQSAYKLRLKVEVAL